VVADLSVGERQRVEIVRCLLQNPRLLILDEPTSVLTPQEADQLFITLRRLAGEGCAILYISHRLEEVRKLCHAATVLRHGKVVAACDPRKETPASLARMMVGSDIHAVRAERSGTLGPVRLELRNLDVAADSAFAVSLKGIDLKVRGGEVLAVAGVAGNGQSELFDAVSGERSAHHADGVLIDGKPCGRADVTHRRRLGAAFVPEERLGHGAIPGFVLSDNVVLTRHAVEDSPTRGFMVDKSAARQVAERVIKAFDVRKGKPDPEARSLSGGNLQKFAVGRELDRKPGVLVVNQPTWGVDAGASATIRQALIDLASSGAAVLVISQDLDEIFEIADRIAVIARGQLSEARPAREMTAEKIGLLMAGAHEVAHAAHS
jgi:simple sugar transport system ATP-binding protein